MRKSTSDEKRISDKTGLLLRFNYVSSVLSLILGFISLYVFDLQGVITSVFFLYVTLNLLNVAIFKVNGNLTVMAIYTSVLSTISTVVITLFSGGINSPFVFLLAIIVLASYVSTKGFGRIYLYAGPVIVVLLFVIDRVNFAFIVNEIPDESRDLFSLAIVLFVVYILGGVFGKELLIARHNLYCSKAEIETRIEEKGTLLKELHHRVKNNLQTVSSLLSLQSKNTGNTELKTMIKSSQNRIKAMALIHEMLYVHHNISRIDFRPYVRELTEYLTKSVDSKDQTVEINIDMPEVKLGIDTAIPLGLLMNEVITNSLQYGFTEKGRGFIDIRFRKKAGMNEYTLDISDNGIGFSKEMDFKNEKSLGLQLIHNLSRQLQGSVQRMDTERGTHYHLKFRTVEIRATASENPGEIKRLSTIASG